MSLTQDFRFQVFSMNQFPWTLSIHFEFTKIRGDIHKSQCCYTSDKLFIAVSNTAGVVVTGDKLLDPGHR